MLVSSNGHKDGGRSPSPWHHPATVEVLGWSSSPLNGHPSFDPELMFLLCEPSPLGWPGQHDPKQEGGRDEEDDPNDDGEEGEHWGVRVSSAA